MLSGNGTDLFNLSLVIYDGGKEFVVGNSQLPMEDLVELVTGDSEEKAVINRTLFVYGTTFSQRENCIIGKMGLEIGYRREKVYEEELKEGEEREEDE